MKPFIEMNAAERKAWLAVEAKEGRLHQRSELTLEKRILDALRYHGPMTTPELADKASSTLKSVTTWATRNKDRLEEIGLVRHLNPDDRRTMVWFLAKQIQVEEQSDAKPPGILGRMRSASVDVGNAVE